MSHDSDPPRLSELRADAPPELRKLFEHARRDVPNDHELGSLLTRLGPVVGAGALAGGDALRAASERAASTSSGGLTLGKLIGGLLAMGAVATGVAWFATGPDQVAPSPPARQAVAAHEEPVAEPPPSQATPPAKSEPGAAREVSTPQRAVAHAPAPVVDSVAAEARLLERARAALQKNPKQALALAREHRTRYPNGVLSQEREVIAIDALRALGRADEANARAGDFKKTYPGSAHQPAVGTKPTP